MQAATRLGETIYKGHRSYDLMLNLQLGIRHSVQAYTKQPPVVQLENEHYTHKVSTAYVKQSTCDFNRRHYCNLGLHIMAVG